jgi:hypothetical protein
MSHTFHTLASETSFLVSYRTLAISMLRTGVLRARAPPEALRSQERAHTRNLYKLLSTKASGERSTSCPHIATKPWGCSQKRYCWP